MGSFYPKDRPELQAPPGLREIRAGRNYWSYWSHRAQGPAGAAGVTGPTGQPDLPEPPDQRERPQISGAMSALNTSASTLSVTTDGTDIPLPVQPYMDGFIADAANTEFAVAQTGTYLISYDIKMTSGLPMSKITLNGTPITNSINTSSASSNEYSVTFMQPLTQVTYWHYNYMA